jgi:TonB family protein
MKLWQRLLVMLLLSTAVLSQTPPADSARAPAPARRVKVDPDDTSALVVQKVAPKYPDGALKAKLQGTVVLDVVVGLSGEVGQVAVVSGDATLAQAAIEAVKQWKYKPYEVNGSPVEMETEVTFNFKLRAEPGPKPAPPLGDFKDDVYSNPYFRLWYPLSTDWIRETQLMQKKVGSGGSSPRAYVLLAAVYVPKNAVLSEVNSSFTLLAVDLPNTDCRRYLNDFAASLRSEKAGQQKGEMSQFAVAGHDFFRGDFEYRTGATYRSTVCSMANGFLLLWNIAATTRTGVETAASTLQSLLALPPAAESSPAPATAAAATAESSSAPGESKPANVRVAMGVSNGLLVKKVQPLYPSEARQAHIQGQVKLGAVINKTGDIVDLEALDGPLELVVSAVNAVRQWKYRPYLLLGKPVAVQTEIIVNYQLSGWNRG